VKADRCRELLYEAVDCLAILLGLPLCPKAGPERLRATAARAKARAWLKKHGWFGAKGETK
jgi:hypothetical protein